MNTYCLHGVLQRIDNPQARENKTGYIVVAIGAEMPKTSKKVQAVNLATVRVPAYLQKRVDVLKIGDAVEIKGRMQGLLKRRIDCDQQFLTVELIAESIYACEVNKSVQDKNTVATFVLLGQLQHKDIPEKDTKPGLMIMKYGPSRCDQGRILEYVNAVNIKTMGVLKRKTAEYTPGQYYEVIGHIRGVLTNIPGGDTQLNIELIADRVRVSRMVAKPAVQTNADSHEKRKEQTEGKSNAAIA